MNDFDDDIDEYDEEDERLEQISKQEQAKRRTLKNRRRLEDYYESKRLRELEQDYYDFD